MIACLMLVLAEGGRIPVDNPTGHFELAMIDDSKSLEYSGPGMALVKWGAHMRLFVLLCILLKIFGLLLVLVGIESSLSKLRLFRIAEFLGAAFVTSVTAMISRLFSF